MFAQDFGVLIAFFLYLVVMMIIGLIYYKKNENMSDYILGGRQLGYWVTSMSAEASDMSGWLLMGLPGFAYTSGLQAIWIAIGLSLGTYINWKWVAKRLRQYTQIAGDSLTLPDYFQNRFHDQSQVLRAVSAIFILIFFLIYTSSGFVAGGKLFETVFGLEYTTAMLLGALVVVFYTFLGGFMAVCWTDFLQGILMFFAIIMVPVAGMFAVGGPAVTTQAIAAFGPEMLNPFLDKDGTSLGLIAIISSLGWGLGYFGQPHILVRFMAIRNTAEIKPARHIAMVWVVFSLLAAVAIGLIGKVYVTPALEGSQSETVFMVMTNGVFSSFWAGLVLSAILAAIMSTASSQLLVTASALSQDFYKAMIRKTASEKEVVWVSRLTVLVISLAAIVLALNPNSLILDIVAYAWAGIGATFGPMILMSLYWQRMTRNGALAGIIVGGLTVLIWKQFSWFHLYEIVPAFALSICAIIVFSLLDQKPSEKVRQDFKKMEQSNI